MRGSIPEAMGRLGALRSLKLHDNFLTGVLPAGLSRLHLLRDLQLSHNQFGMQDRESLAAILGGMVSHRSAPASPPLSAATAFVSASVQHHFSDIYAHMLLRRCT